ncbi:MAG: hypothetical protein OHK0021_17810 [Bryobacter sp.]
MLWAAARQLRKDTKHPIFGLHILVQFLAGWMIASGFFSLRLLERLDSPLLQATLFVGYCLTLDLCWEALGWRRLSRPVWLTLSFLFATAGAFYLHDFPPAVRERDLGQVRVRFLGRTVFERRAPVCLSPAALARIPWNADALRKADLGSACLAWPYRLDLPQVFRECVKEPLRPLAPADMPREDKLLHAGNPEVGQVFFLGQVHQRSEDTPQQRWSVLDSQRLIYEELKKFPQRPVFHEATCQGERTEATTSLPDGGSRWTPAFEQLLLASIGAVGALEEAGQLSSLPTSRCDDARLAELDRLETQIDMTDPAAPQYESLYERINAIRMDYREGQAIRFIARHLRNFPGDEVFLVYGEAHIFPEALWQEHFGVRLPRVVATRWTTPITAFWDLEPLEDPAERLDWIQRAPGMPVSALGLVRNRAELFALLPKLRPEPLRDPSRADLAGRLLSLLDGLPFPLAPADHLRVSDWFWHCRRRGLGPFEGYGWSAAQRTQPIGDLLGPYQQWMAVRTRSRITLADYQDLALAEARLEALPKLDIPRALSREEIRDFLATANTLVIDMGGKLEKAVEARFRE